MDNAGKKIIKMLRKYRRMSDIFIMDKLKDDYSSTIVGPALMRLLDKEAICNDGKYFFIQKEK